MRKTDKCLEDYYIALASGDSNTIQRMHLPHSSVFYAREAYYQHSGEWITLKRMEAAMKAEGLNPEKD